MDETFYSNNSDEFGKLSKINSAGLVNSTLSNLWSDFFRHYRDGKYLAANSDLDCIWTILGGEKNIEESPAESEYKKIELKLYESGTLTNSLDIKGFGKVNQDDLTKIASQKIILLKKALFLRRLQNSQGKGTAYHDGEDEDMD